MNPLLLLGALAYLSGKKKAPTRTVGDSGITAFLYQLPDDGPTTTRVAISSGGSEPQPMGIFGSVDKAIAVAQASGWTVAHGGQVLQLKANPTAG